MNPFLNIKLEDELWFKEEIKKIAEMIKKGKITVVFGTPGIGRSERIKCALKLLKGFKIYEFYLARNLLDELREFLKKPEEKLVIAIYKMELIDGIEKDEMKKILGIMRELCDVGIKFVLDGTPQSLNKMIMLDPAITKYLTKYRVEGISFEKAKEMVKRRLKEAEEKFEISDELLRQIWEASKGHPRMILMLCAELWEKMR